MPFRFRRSSFQQCRSKNGRREVMPAGNNQADRGITSRDGSACVQLHPPPRTHGDDVTGSDVSQFATTVDVYEDRIDELGQLMAEQGRCLDELTTRSRRLSSENNMLRERLSSAASGVVVKQSSPRGSFSLPARSPLKHIIRNSQRSSNDDATTKQVVKKLNDENSLLIQQAELLANELTDANSQLAERDKSLASLETKLSSSLEKARSLMMEKKMWKVELSQKMKEIDSLQASAKRSNSCRSVITQKAEQYLADRCDLESEVADLETQISFMTSTIDKQAHQLITKQIELEKAIEKVCKLEQEAKTAKVEAKNNAEAAQDCQCQLHRSHSHNKELEQKLIEARDKVAENEISQYKLRKLNESLRVEVKEMSEMHALQVSTWEKGQSKVMAALKEKHCEENQSNQKRIDNLMRVHASLEIENAQCQRDLQSYQHRCSAHEKHIERSGNESRETIDKLLLKVNEVEMKLEAYKSIERDLKAKVSMLEEQLASSHVLLNEKENTLTGVTDGLRAQLEAIHAENQTLLHRKLCLEEQVEKIQLDYTKEQHRMQQVSEQKVNELSIVCEALKAAIKNEKIKSQQAEDTLKQMQSLHENLIDQITTEKKELSMKLEKVILVEREIGTSLMNKVQELNSKVQRLTSEKYQLNHQAKQHVDQIYNLEKVIANGELKLSQFAKQLTRSMQEQERQILKEVDLNKELNTARMEVEKMKKRVIDRQGDVCLN